MKKSIIAKGDYVVATKYSDGDPKDKLDFTFDMVYKGKYIKS